MAINESEPRDSLDPKVGIDVERPLSGADLVANMDREITYHPNHLLAQLRHLGWVAAGIIAGVGSGILINSFFGFNINDKGSYPIGIFVLGTTTSIAIVATALLEIRVNSRRSR